MARTWAAGPPGLPGRRGRRAPERGPPGRWGCPWPRGRRVRAETHVVDGPRRGVIDGGSMCVRRHTSDADSGSGCAPRPESLGPSARIGPLRVPGGPIAVESSPTCISRRTDWSVPARELRTASPRVSPGAHEVARGERESPPTRAEPEPAPASAATAPRPPSTPPRRGLARSVWQRRAPGPRARRCPR